MSRPPLAIVALLVATWASGCAAPLGMGRPATVIEPGHVRASLDVGMRVSPGAADVQEASRIAQRDHTGLSCGNELGRDVCLDDRAWRDTVRGATAGLLSSPQSAEGGLAVRYGVRPGMDAGVRLGTAAVRGEVAWQVYGDPLNSTDSGVTALVGAGVSHQLELGRQPEHQVTLSGEGRNDLDLFALAGYRYYRKAYLTMGARYMLSHLQGELTPVGTDQAEVPADALGDTDISGLSHHVGLVVSAFAGFGAAYVGIEIAGGVDFMTVRALGEDSTVSAASFRPGLVFFLEI